MSIVITTRLILASTTPLFVLPLRRRRTLLGRLFESIVVGLIIIFGLLAWFVVWACVVAAPWVLLALILKWIGVI